MSVEKLFDTTSELQKNQMYNWFDKYKPREQQKVYILNCEPQEKTRLRTPLVRRRSLKEV